MPDDTAIVFLLFGPLPIYTAAAVGHRDDVPDVEDTVMIEAAWRRLPITAGPLAHTTRAGRPQP